MDFKPGSWRKGKDYGAIVSDEPCGNKMTPANRKAYGGELVCESVAKRAESLIIAAPDMLAACKAVAAFDGGKNIMDGSLCPFCQNRSHDDDCPMPAVVAAITKATA